MHKCPNIIQTTILSCFSVDSPLLTGLDVILQTVLTYFAFHCLQQVSKFTITVKQMFWLRSFEERIVQPTMHYCQTLSSAGMNRPSSESHVTKMHLLKQD